jgi:P pilus assembly chaperone PapD
VLLSATTAAAAVQISRIQYDPPGNDSGSNTSLNREFIVIENDGTSRVTLTGWTLRDASGHVLTFGSLRLRPHRSVTVHTGRGNDDRNDIYWDTGEYVWNNDGDAAVLRNETGHRVDRCRYPGGGNGVTDC